MLWKKRKKLADCKTKAGPWEVSLYFARVKNCYEWHIRPSTFNLCAPAEDEAVMLAFLSDKNRMEAYEREQHEKELKLNRKRRK